jgi:uncharacterized membrane protein
VGKNLYLDNIGSLLLMNGQTITPRLLPALGVYILFAIMIWFIVLPLAEQNITLSFAYGALLGLVVYGIYDLTNLATLQAWTTKIALIDSLWGMFICSMTSGFCAFLNKLMA